MTDAMDLENALDEVESAYWIMGDRSNRKTTRYRLNPVLPGATPHEVNAAAAEPPALSKTDQTYELLQANPTLTFSVAKAEHGYEFSETLFHNVKAKVLAAHGS